MTDPESTEKNNIILEFLSEYKWVFLFLVLWLLIASTSIVISNNQPNKIQKVVEKQTEHNL